MHCVNRCKCCSYINCLIFSLHDVNKPAYRGKEPPDGELSPFDPPIFISPPLFTTCSLWLILETFRKIDNSQFDGSWHSLFVGGERPYSIYTFLQITHFTEIR